MSKQSLADALPHTSVEPVTGEARVAEIARMLSGDDDERALDMHAPCSRRHADDGVDARQRAV